MSLDDSQRAQTSRELLAALAACPVDDAQLDADLGMTRARVERIAHVEDGVDPVDVWFLRDYLDAVLRLRGQQPAWTTLTDANRLRAEGWFGLREAPTPSR